MRCLIQRVSSASVSVSSKRVSAIGKGLLLLVGFAQEDTTKDFDWICHKVLRMRIFKDESDKMNCSLLDVGGELLIVSQFTLFASVRKGNRPSYTRAALLEEAQIAYDTFVNMFRRLLPATSVHTGIFAADMQVASTNDGPVTLLIDSCQRHL